MGELRGMPADVRHGLDSWFAVDERKQNVSRPGDSFRPTYIAANAVIRRLNDVLGHDWSFHASPYTLSPDGREVIVMGTLVVSFGGEDSRGEWHDRCVTKQQYGQAILKVRNGQYWDFGKDVKAATTDAMRKCASMLGVGLHLYENDESPFQGYPEPGQSPQDQMSQPAHEFQVKQVCDLFRRLGVPDTEWPARVGLQRDQQMSMEQALSIINGYNPFVRELLQNSGAHVNTGLQVRQ